jgi:transposase
LGLCSKKTLKASEQEREDIVQARCEWREFQRIIDANRLVFLDETGAKTDMTRRYGRSFRGDRCRDSAPNGHWKTVTILSSLRLDGSAESVVFDGAIDKKMFDEYIKEFLAPCLRPGDIVIADNLSSHKSQKALNTIKKSQATLIFLPAYSPDLNPIEKMWSKVKQVLRGLKARSHDELFEGISKALELVSTSDAQGWFESCGYTQFVS